MPLEEQMYSTQQIKIPPKLPYILKKYAKAAIRTQPYDLLRWSMEYFKALAEGYVPPVKCRFEHPVFATQGGLTRGFLKVLVKQLADVNPVPMDVLEAKWLGACLHYDELKMILCICEALHSDTVDKLRFFAVAASLLTQSLKMTMVLLCESLTKEPDGASARIPKDQFLHMYKFLAPFNGARKWRYVDGVREDKLNIKFKSKDEGSIEEEELPEDQLAGEGESVTEEGFEIPEIVLTECEDLVVEEEEVPEEPVKEEAIAVVKLEEEETAEDKKEEAVVEEEVEEEEDLDIGEKYAKDRRRRVKDVTQTIDDLAEIVKICKAANYDLGMIAGRQMSMTSGEFVAEAIQTDLLEMVGRQIDDLPPPRPRRMKLTPCEVEGIADMVNDIFNNIIDNCLPEEVTEISSDRPDIVTVPPIPGIGPVVPEEMRVVFVAFCEEVAAKQQDLVMPRNMRHFLCPPMEVTDEKIQTDNDKDISQRNGINKEKIMPIIKEQIHKDIVKRFSEENINKNGSQGKVIESYTKQDTEEKTTDGIEGIVNEHDLKDLGKEATINVEKIILKEDDNIENDDKIENAKEPNAMRDVMEEISSDVDASLNVVFNEDENHAIKDNTSDHKSKDAEIDKVADLNEGNSSKNQELEVTQCIDNESSVQKVDNEVLNDIDDEEKLGAENDNLLVNDIANLNSTKSTDIDITPAEKSEAITDDLDIDLSNDSENKAELELKHLEIDHKNLSYSTAETVELSDQSKTPETLIEAQAFEDVEKDDTSNDLQKFDKMDKLVEVSEKLVEDSEKLVKINNEDLSGAQVFEENDTGKGSTNELLDKEVDKTDKLIEDTVKSVKINKDDLEAFIMNEKIASTEAVIEPLCVVKKIVHLNDATLNDSNDNENKVTEPDEGFGKIAVEEAKIFQ